MRMAASRDSARASVAPPRASDDTISACRPNLRFGTGPVAGASAASTAGALPAMTTPALAVLSAFRKLRRCCLWGSVARSEEHTSELQSLRHLVCRLLLEK